MVFAFCRRILERGDLESKLTPPGAEDFAEEPRAHGGLPPLRPARDSTLVMQSGAGPLPRPGELADPAARARCLARFAHHELMAAEMFAWAILRWPELSLDLRRGLLGILRDEQRHCGLYLERLADHGNALSDHVLSDYFWKHVPAISEAPDGPAAFFAAMGLTFEQGNLDFAALYRDAFESAGDAASAGVCEVIRRDEIGHVRFAAEALRGRAGAIAGERLDDVELYERTVPFPLSAARAKGRRFDAHARLEAGLSPEFIEYVRTARPPQQLRQHPDRSPPSRGTARGDP